MVGGRRGDEDLLGRGGGNKGVERLGDLLSVYERNGDTQGERKNGAAVTSTSATAGTKSTTSSQMGPERHAAAKALTSTKVALPHHLAPMAGLEDKLRKMRLDMENGRGEGDAPWGAFGRPRTTLGGAKAHK